MKLSTGAYQSLRGKQTTGGFMTGSSDQVGAQPDFAGGADQVSSAIADFLSEMTAADQRHWRDINIWTDIAIRRRMDALRDQPWKVGAIDPKLPVDQALVDEITTVLDAPNEGLEDNTFGALWGMAMDDVYTIGRGSVQRILNKNRTARAFRALDAAKLTENPKWEQDFPMRTFRWEFAEKHGEPPKQFMSDEIIVLVPYMSTHDRRGLSPMRSLKAILQAELDTRRKMHFAQKYGTPPGAFIMPGAAPGSPGKMRLMYDLKAAGKPTIMFMNLPKDSKFVNFSDVNLITHGTFQFYEIIVRATAASFGTTPFVLGWTDQDNRANSQTQLTITDRGEGAMLKFLKQILNRYVIGPYKRAYGSRANNIGFDFLSLLDEDEIEDSASLRAKSGDIGFASINDIRAAGGLAQYTEEEVGSAYWPFFSQPWVPSRLRGVFLPVKYAAMTWGIDDGFTDAQMLDALMLQGLTQPAPLALPEEYQAAGVGDRIAKSIDGENLLDVREGLVNGQNGNGAKELHRLVRQLIEQAD